MSSALKLSVVFIAVWSMMMLSTTEPLGELAGVNALVQLTLFAVVACVPFLRTGRMSHVDIAWPFGVASIGALLLIQLGTDSPRTVAVAAVYLFIGLRMGIGALVMGKATGVIFKTEFPRYRYRREMLEAEGGERVTLHMLVDILAQGFANMSVLALPAFLLAANTSAEISPWEVAGLALWGVAYIIESVADAQKLRFISKDDSGLGVCDIGLWRYSRHPNYFAEWLVWTALVVAAVPSWLALQTTETTAVWIALGLGTLGASAALYTTLVYLTGAIPAEHYSVQKRPGYRAYQERTNRFFPWFPSVKGRG